MEPLVSGGVRRLERAETVLDDSESALAAWWRAVREAPLRRGAGAAPRAGCEEKMRAWRY